MGIKPRKSSLFSLSSHEERKKREEKSPPTMEMNMVAIPDTAMSAELLKAMEAFFKNGKPARKGKKAKGRAKITPEQSAMHKANNDAECIRVFTAAGYKDVQPRVNVLTYGKVKPDGTVTGWLSKGRRVKKGEKSHQVGPFRLFHIDQTEEIGAEAVAESPKAEASATVFNWNE